MFKWMPRHAYLSAFDYVNLLHSSNREMKYDYHGLLETLVLETWRIYFGVGVYARFWPRGYIVL